MYKCICVYLIDIIIVQYYKLIKIKIKKQIIKWKLIVVRIARISKVITNILRRAFCNRIKACLPETESLNQLHSFLKKDM